MRARISARFDFHKLWTASAVSNLGDGVTIAAGPLLVAQLTQNPALVAGAPFMQQLPWLLFALLSGAYVDRVDRRKLVVLVNVLRGLVLAILAVTIAADVVSIPIVYATYFLLGLGETFADTASAALLPAIVPKEKLASANAKLMATFTISNQFAAKPLGAWLFAAAAALPFAVDAVSFLIAAALVAAVRKAPAPEKPRKTNIKEGVRWLMNHRVLRTLATTMGVANVVFCAAFAIFVLYVQQRLGLDEIGYGVLLTTFAVGGLIGTAIAARLQTRFPARVLLRAGLIVETLTHLILAVTDNWLVAGTILVVFGVHTMVWGVIVVTMRQRVVPDSLLGRVTSVYMLLDLGGAALGSLIGGLIAQALGVTAPFWIAAGVMVLICVAAWRPLREA
ncbi:MFS transporter [Kibdelosporangium aridum]|uniref:MFS transporter n=1 Tax=Kibdelosporangium aridum TaxID=2030 RepID=A0A428ZAD2_KIBAR|nr:MFS transporter [Kibdelosporangium aridum]RSM85037.1 MFS transporter [Kibdelosporangium aridum]